VTVQCREIHGKKLDWVTQSYDDVKDAIKTVTRYNKRKAGK
jgi:hypothetical protein